MNQPPNPTSGGVCTVPETLGGRPLDGVVRALFSVTWGKARAWVEAGKVEVDGAVVTDLTRRVRAGVKIVVTVSAPRGRAHAGAASSAGDGAPAPGGRARAVGRALGALTRSDVVHVDAHVLVVAKPSGISTVPYRGTEGPPQRGGRTGRAGASAGRRPSPDAPTLDALVRDLLERTQPKARTGGRPPLGVVHRIDKETSGLVVFTRTWLAKQSLASQFRAHTVHRRYFALVHGRARDATCRSHLIDDRGDGVRGSVEAIPSRRGRGMEGQLAVPHVEVVARLEGATLVACRLETGRTHQIRIHLSEAGNPLVGERVYVRGFAGRAIEGREIPASRLMLHAAELGFVHPATEQMMQWDLPWPADFEETVSRLRRSEI